MDTPMNVPDLIEKLDELGIETTIEGMVAHLGRDLQNVVQTNASGWFAYVNSHISGATIRSAGETMWLALANVCYAKELAKTQNPDIESITAPK